MISFRGSDVLYKRVPSIVLLLLLLAVSSRGLEIAKYGGEFMSGGVGGRALGMGGAYVAVGGDVTFGYWNPAGLSDITYPELAGMHARRFGGVVNYDFAAFATPFRSFSSLGLSVVRLAVDDIPITALPRPNLPIDSLYTDENGQSVGNRPYVQRLASDAEYAVYLSYAKRFNQKWAFGANVKVVQKGVDTHSAWGLGFDVGALWRPAGNLRLGANFQDITTTLLAWDTGRRELISPTLKFGAAYPLVLPFLRSQLLLASDCDLRMEGRKMAAQAHLGQISADFHAGAEFLFHRLIALRIGSDTGSLSAGAGLRLPRLDIDYAFLKHADLDDSHRISLNIRLEEPRFARQK